MRTLPEPFDPLQCDWTCFIQSKSLQSPVISNLNMNASLLCCRTNYSHFRMNVIVKYSIVKVLTHKSLNQQAGSLQFVGCSGLERN